MPKALKLAPLIRKQLLDAFQSERPSFSGWDLWIGEKAEQFQVPVKAVREFFARHLEMIDVQVQLQSLPAAQKIAVALGAGRAEAIATLKRNLHATKVRAVRMEIPRNAEGKADGKPIYHEIREPDVTGQNQAARALLDLWGGFAPQEIHVKHSVVEEFKKLSDEEVRERIKVKMLEAAKFEAEPDVRPN